MTAPAKPVPAVREPLLLPNIFGAAFGGFLGLALLKFGNPPIMERYTTAPTNIYEFVIGSPWPIVWAFWLLTAVTVLGLLVARRNSRLPLWLVLLPLVWVFWQLLATTQSLDSRLSYPTLAHFIACLICFYLGCFSLRRVERVGWFWTGLLVGFVLVLAGGWEQHFGGLEATRRWFYAYVYPEAKEVAPEYLKKLSSNRIFSTLFYPNSLAGALLLFLPPMLGVVWSVRRFFTVSAGCFLALLLALPALGCLYWSGSKGGWLLMLVLSIVAFLALPVRRQFKLGLVITLLLVGGAGFAAKYAGFFQKGAPSVVARLDYWRAALQVTKSRPVFGSGPGTFAITYAAIKRPEAEMTRLVHNDYLEQACESGLPGCVTYTLLIAGVLFRTAPLWVRAASIGNARLPVGGSPGGSGATNGRDWLAFSVWLGVLGWALQGLVEFDLYLPALAWPAFAFLGWLLGRSGMQEAEAPAGARAVSGRRE